MAESKLTSEEKLLHIIEKGLPAGKKSAEAAPAVALPKPDLKALLSLASISKMVIAVCLLLTFLWFADFLKQRNWFGQGVERLSAADPKITRALVTPAPEEKEIALSDLQQEAAARNIFTLFPVKAEEKEVPAVDYGALVKELRLVGILWSNTPQAMVENTREGKTSLLSVKDTIGEFNVARILQDRVVLGKDGKEWELR